MPPDGFEAPSLFSAAALWIPVLPVLTWTTLRAGGLGRRARPYAPALAGAVAWLGVVSLVLALGLSSGGRSGLAIGAMTLLFTVLGGVAVATSDSAQPGRSRTSPSEPLRGPPPPDRGARARAARPSSPPGVGRRYADVPDDAVGVLLPPSPSGGAGRRHHHRASTTAAETAIW